MSEPIEALQTLAQSVIAAKPDAELTAHISHGELTLVCARDYFLDVVSYLYQAEECQFVNFIDLCGADYPSRTQRFEVVLHLLSPKFNRRIRLKCATDEIGAVPSLTSIYPAANWFEREAYDLFGILFAGHPELRRILTDYGFEGYPLRKDFPMTGFVEVRYDDQSKRVVHEPVKLVQDFRQFDFLSPWEGANPVLPGDEKAKN